MIRWQERVVDVEGRIKRKMADCHDETSQRQSGLNGESEKTDKVGAGTVGIFGTMGGKGMRRRSSVLLVWNTCEAAERGRIVYRKAHTQTLAEKVT